MPQVDTGSIDDAIQRFVAQSRYTLQERSGVMRDSLMFEPLPLNNGPTAVSYTHLRAHETELHLVCRLLLEKKFF